MRISVSELGGCRAALEELTLRLMRLRNALAILEARKEASEVDLIQHEAFYVLKCNGTL